MWQKARALTGQFRGYLVWSEVGSLHSGYLEPPNGLKQWCEAILRSNVTGPIGPLGIDCSKVELLPEFADDVPLIDFDTWRQQS